MRGGAPTEPALPQATLSAAIPWDTTVPTLPTVSPYPSSHAGRPEPPAQRLAHPPGLPHAWHTKPNAARNPSRRRFMHLLWLLCFLGAPWRI
jgi:hypothetical protein